tara:strand:- start:3698 stop:3916 length:219 start_codon:yes stop_codon:yes gene_type:complete
MKHLQLTFILEKDEVKKSKKWIKKQERKHIDEHNDINDRFSYNFTQTRLGYTSSITDNLTGKKKVLRDFNYK